jgi:hypothetical protein
VSACLIAHFGWELANIIVCHGFQVVQLPNIIHIMNSVQGVQFFVSSLSSNDILNLLNIKQLCEFANVVGPITMHALAVLSLIGGVVGCVQTIFSGYSLLKQLREFKRAYKLVRDELYEPLQGLEMNLREIITLLKIKESDQTDWKVILDKRISYLREQIKCVQDKFTKFTLREEAQKVKTFAGKCWEYVLEFLKVIGGAFAIASGVALVGFGATAPLGICAIIGGSLSIVSGFTNMYTLYRKNDAAEEQGKIVTNLNQLEDRLKNLGSIIEDYQRFGGEMKFLAGLEKQHKELQQNLKALDIDII